MSDENHSDTEVPKATPATGGAFDWLVESHQQSAPMAPLSDDIPAPGPTPLGSPMHASVPSPVPAARPSYFLPPAVAPSAPAATPSAPAVAPAPPEPPVPTYLAAPPPTAPPPTAPPPTAPAPAAPAPAEQATMPPVPVDQTPPGVFSFASEPLRPASFAGVTGAPALALERSTSRAPSATGPLDWIALVLAFLAPPVGLLLGIAAALTSSRSKGYAAGVAKAAIGIGAALSLVLGVALVVVTKINNDQAAHASIVASSAAWCTKLKSDPAALASDTLGWPSPGDTIPASITKMKAYESRWKSLAKVAPAGILADTQKVADTAKSIVTAVTSTQTLNDSGNVAQMQNVIATSGIRSWVSSYCN